MNAKRTKRGGKALRGVLLAAAAGAWGAGVAWGQNTPAVTWDAAAGAYTNGNNWDPDLAGGPANTANQFLTINNGGTAQVVAGDAAEGAFLMLGLKPGDVGHLQVSGGTLTLGELRVGGRETVPSNLADWAAGTLDPNGGGTGTVVQTGGTVNVTYSPGGEPPVQSLYIGDSSLPAGNTADGSYRITGGSLLVGIANNDAIIAGSGPGAKGAFVQEGGTVTSTGFVTVGRRGASATWTMSAGTLNVQGTPGLVIADGEVAAVASATGGTLTQTGGEVKVAGNVEVGKRSGTGTYAMSGGKLDVTGQLVVGSVGSVSPGTNSSNGTMTVSKDAAITIGTNLFVTFGSATTATTGVGTLNVEGGTIGFTGSAPIFAVGNGRGTNGTVNHSAGTIELNDPAVHVGAANVSVGRNNSSGTYNLSGSGVLNAKTVTMETALTAGDSATRVFNVTGGTLTAGTFNFTNSSTAATRSFNVSGGTVTIGTLRTGQAATTYVSGGTFAVTTELALTTNGTFRTAVPSLNLSPLVSLGTAGNTTVQVDSGTLEFSGTVASAGATLVKTGAGTLTISGAQNHSGAAAAITNSAGGGTVNINTDGGANLTVNANSGTTTFGASQTLKAVKVAAGATVKVIAGGNKQVNLGSLSITGGATFDLTNNLLRVDLAGTPAAAIRGYLQAAYNHGRWNQPGLTSSTVAANVNGGTSLGYADDGSKVTVLYTWLGDLNLDGVVNVDDSAALNLGDGSQWSAGDLNYDGKKSSDDYALFSLGLALSGGAPIAAAAVPEPATVGLVALIAAAVAGNRRRR